MAVLVKGLVYSRGIVHQYCPYSTVFLEVCMCVCVLIMEEGWQAKVTKFPF